LIMAVYSNLTKSTETIDATNEEKVDKIKI
jgi:hypothetical protein